MYEAQSRLLKMARAHWHGNVRMSRGLESLPLWVSNPSTPIEVIAGSVNMSHTMCVVHQIRQLRAEVEADSHNTPTDPEFDPAQPVVDPEMDPCLVVAIARLAFGDFLEAFVAFKAQRICGPTDVLPPRDPNFKTMARLFQDSYLMSVWTSAHAQYVACAFDLIDHHRKATRRDPEIGAVVEEESNEQEDANTGAVNKSNVCIQFAPPSPGLYSVPCASNTPDLTSLYERTSAGKTCEKTSQGMLAVLSRATNAGSRGWEATLTSALQNSDGAAKFCHHAVQVALCGLHPCIHPLARPSWQKRMMVIRANPLAVQRSEMLTFAKNTSNAVKEAIRLSLASLLNENMASLSVYIDTNQPMRQLAIPPLSMPNVSLQSCMQSFAAVGVHVSTNVCTIDQMGEMLTSRISSEPRSRKKAQAATAQSQPPPPPPTTLASNLTYCCSWMGGRAGNGSNTPLSVSSVLSGLLSASFRVEFSLLWMHSTQHKERLSRLDDAQYQALHTRNPCHQLVGMLDAKHALRAQRLAMRLPQASILTVHEVSKILDMRSVEKEEGDTATHFGVGTSTTSNRAVQEGESSVLSLDGESMAKLTVFGQTASLRNQLLTYNLGNETRRRQIRALVRRFLVDRHCPEIAAELDMLLLDPSHPCTEILKRLPKHATRVFICSECKRIVNACQTGAGKDAAFNELGLSASMLRIDGKLSDGEMRCARRSSAALRTAVSLEELADSREVECNPCFFDTVEKMPVDLRPASVVRPPSWSADRDPQNEKAPASETASDVAKLRRDVKNCYEQHPKAIACGEVPLVSVDILGLCIRVFHEWHSLCSLCGCLMRMTSSTRFGAEPCCNKCDFSMLFGKDLEAKLLSQQPKPQTPTCRLCGKPQPMTMNSKWRCVNAPADNGGRNATVPPPLRKCWCVYECPIGYTRCFKTNRS